MPVDNYNIETPTPLGPNDNLLHRTFVCETLNTRMSCNIGSLHGMGKMISSSLSGKDLSRSCRLTKKWQSQFSKKNPVCIRLKENSVTILMYCSDF